MPNVIDVRNIGLMGAVELSPRDGAPGRRGYEVFLAALSDGLYARYTGDIIALSPPLIVSESEISRIVEILARAIKAAG